MEQTYSVFLALAIDAAAALDSTPLPLPLALPLTTPLY